MATVDLSKLQLIPEGEVGRTKAKDPKGRRKSTDKDLQYDPHLKEEEQRKRAGLTGSPAVTWEDETKKRYVDCIAKLANPDDKIPPEITGGVCIGDGIVTGTIDVDDIAKVVADRSKVKSLKAATDLYLDLYHSVPAIHCDPESLENTQGPNGMSFPGLDGSGVVIGIVDFGCDFRHRNFRQASGATRIRYLWDQTGGRTTLSPTPYGYGREFSANLINQALRDEDRAYEILGDAPGVDAHDIGYAPDAGAHGTHVMDIAAGNGREPNDFGGRPGPASSPLSHPGIAPNSLLVFVHLETFEKTFLGNSRCLLEAVHYIFKKADDLKLPAVVNLSLSGSGGPHDGTTLVEQGLAALVNAKPGRAIVVSAGNSYGKQSHFTGKVRKGEPATIRLYTDPRHSDPDTTKNEMEVWYAGDQELQVTLFAPGSKSDYPIGTVSLGDTQELFEGDRATGRRLGRIVHRYYDPNNEDNHIDIRLPHLDGVQEPWRIELSTEEEGKEIEFHAWIEQDDLGLARFEESTTDSTIGSISCNDALVAVGAFDTAVNACLAPPLAASSAGPTRRTKTNDPPRHKPDLSAPGVNIVAARARGGVTAMSGTSAATPHVTGLVALLFQLVLRSGYDLTPFAIIRELLSEPVDEKEPAGLTLLKHVVNPKTVFFPQPHPQLGVGRVDGSQAAGFLASLHDEAQKLTKAEERSPLAPNMKKNGNGVAKDFYVLAQFLQGQPDNGGNGSSDFSDLLRLIANKLQNDEKLRLRVEP